MKLESLSEKKKKIKKQLKKNQKIASKDTFHEGYQQGVDASFDSIVDSMKAYQYYKDDVKKLMEEQKGIWKQWVSFYENKPTITKDNYLISYNNWLLEYLFLHEEQKYSESLLQL